MSSPAFQIRSRVPRLPETAAARARLSVVPRRRVRAARMPFVALVSLILLSGVIGLLLFNTSMQQASFAATALESQATSLTAREQTLRMELDVLRNPQRVAEQAKKMGMVTGGVPAPLDLRTGEITGPAAPAGPTTDLRINPRRTLPAILDPAPIEIPFEDSLAGTSAGLGASATEQGARGGRNESQQQQATQDQQQDRN